MQARPPPVYLLTVPHATCPVVPDPADSNTHPCDIAAVRAATRLHEALGNRPHRVFMCATPRFGHDANRTSGCHLPMRIAHRNALRSLARSFTLDVHSFPAGQFADDVHFMDYMPLQPWMPGFVDGVRARLSGLRVAFREGTAENDITRECREAGKPVVLIEFSEGLDGREMAQVCNVIVQMLDRLSNSCFV
jgi:hypothetical protein